MSGSNYETATLLELLSAQAHVDWEKTVAEHPEYDSAKHKSRFLHSWLVECWADFWSLGEKPDRRAAFVRLVSWQETREENVAKKQGELFPDFHDEFFEELQDDVDHLAI